MKQFLPCIITLKYRIKYRIKKEKDYDFKFVQWNKNKMNIMEKIFSKLHYLGSHSYVTNKWKKVERKFLKQHPNRF